MPIVNAGTIGGAGGSGSDEPILPWVETEAELPPDAPIGSAYLVGPKPGPYLLFIQWEGGFSGGGSGLTEAAVNTLIANALSALPASVPTVVTTGFPAMSGTDTPRQLISAWQAHPTGYYAFLDRGEVTLVNLVHIDSENVVLGIHKAQVLNLVNLSASAADAVSRTLTVGAEGVFTSQAPTPDDVFSAPAPLGAGGGSGADLSLYAKKVDDTQDIINNSVAAHEYTVGSHDSDGVRTSTPTEFRGQDAGVDKKYYRIAIRNTASDGSDAWLPLAFQEEVDESVAPLRATPPMAENGVTASAWYLGRERDGTVSWRPTYNVQENFYGVYPPGYDPNDNGGLTGTAGDWIATESGTIWQYRSHAGQPLKWHDMGTISGALTGPFVPVTYSGAATGTVQTRVIHEDTLQVIGVLDLSGAPIASAGRLVFTVSPDHTPIDYTTLSLVPVVTQAGRIEHAQFQINDKGEARITSLGGSDPIVGMYFSSMDLYIGPRAVPAARSGESLLDDRVDINTASHDELIQVHRIGDHFAHQIIELRESRDEPLTLSDLTSISGISASVVDHLSDKIKGAESE